MTGQAKRFGAMTTSQRAGRVMTRFVSTDETANTAKKPCKIYAPPQLALQPGRLNCRAKHECTDVECQQQGHGGKKSFGMSKRYRPTQPNALHPSQHIPVRRPTQPLISSHQSMQHVTGIRPQCMAVPTVATASAAGPPRAGKTLPATEGGLVSPPSANVQHHAPATSLPSVKPKLNNGSVTSKG